MGDPLRVVGRSVPRVDALAKVTGQELYPGDLTRPGMLCGQVLFAGRPHAKILRIDTQAAAALPGVVAVFTGRDVPVNDYGLEYNDQPVLCDEVVRCEGDQVALVVAESELIARQACGLIDVSYQDLPRVTDPRQAMAPGALRLHASCPDNILDHIHICKGDLDAGFAQASAIVEENYYVPMQEHAYLQPEAGLAYMDGGVVVVETAGQWAHHDQRQIARALDLPVERVRVIYRAIGGAFGGREDVSIQIVLALAAWKTGRPVKTIWSREESIRGHGKRHQMFIKARWGADRDGRLTAAEVEVISDAGAYAFTSSMVLGHTALTSTGAYKIPNVTVDAYAVYTNNVPAGAFRGFGAPQGIFAAEGQIDRLAEALTLDPITMRERNVMKAGDELPVGTSMPDSIHLDRLLAECAQRAGWKKTESGWVHPGGPTAQVTAGTVRRGTGIALGYKNIGFSFGYPEVSSVKIQLDGDKDIDRATVFFAGAECGQGVHTVISQIAAEALGLAMDEISLVGADTALSPEAGSASASRLTLMGGNAILGAARLALESWASEDRPAVGSFTYHAPLTSDFDSQTGQGKPYVVFSPVVQAVEVEVDSETGELRLPRVITVVDVGKAVNPAAVTGQVEGAVAQALGYAVLENFISREGVILTPNLSTYLLPTVLDMPASVESHVVENTEPVGPWGARGMGETPFIAFAPALVSAVHAATGVWFDRLPLTPPAVLAGLQSENRSGDQRSKATKPTR